MISQGPPKHKLQFLIGDVVLPFNMTVYQAVRQFGCSGVDHSEAEADSEPPLGHDAVWVQTHTIYYRYFQTQNRETSTIHFPSLSFLFKSCTNIFILEANKYDFYMIFPFLFLEKYRLLLICKEIFHSF